jgi:hypothetical protein
MKIEWRHFMNTTDEFHVFIIGLCEIIAPWRAVTGKAKCGEGLLRTICNEYHYYVFGRAIGVIAWLIIALIIAIIVNEAFF